jgi:hypothetical protein
MLILISEAGLSRIYAFSRIIYLGTDAGLLRPSSFSQYAIGSLIRVPTQLLYKDQVICNQSDPRNPDGVTSSAFLTLCSELTNPFNWSSPLDVSSLIWNACSDGSSTIASFSSEVITESSGYPLLLLSRFCVTANPKKMVISPIQNKKITIR